MSITIGVTKNVQYVARITFLSFLTNVNFEVVKKKKTKTKWAILVWN
jgi:hypothetical protein